MCQWISLLLQHKIFLIKFNDEITQCDEFSLFFYIAHRRSFICKLDIFHSLRIHWEKVFRLINSNSSSFYSILKIKWELLQKKAFVSLKFFTLLLLRHKAWEMKYTREVVHILQFSSFLNWILLFYVRVKKKENENFFIPCCIISLKLCFSLALFYGLENNETFYIFLFALARFHWSAHDVSSRDLFKHNFLVIGKGLGWTRNDSLSLHRSTFLLF